MFNNLHFWSPNEHELCILFFFQISIIVVQFEEYLQVAWYVNYFYARGSLIFQEQ